MKAQIIPNHVCKFTTSHRKEGKCFFSSLSVVSLADKPRFGGRLDPRVTLRLYGTGNRNFACLWVHAEPIHRNGSGWAGGYGYHRPSAAAAEAIHNAGFKISADISGGGEEAMREAVLAVAKAAGVKRPAIVEAHP